MLLHREEISVNGPYQPCSSTFVRLELVRLPQASEMLLGVVTLCDARGDAQGVIRTQPFECVDFCMVVTRLLPFNLAVPPRVMPASLTGGLQWEERDISNRSLVYLHSVYDRMRTSGYRIPFFNFLLRILEHTSNLRLTFVVKDDQLAEVEVTFGSAQESALTVRGRPPRHLDILRDSFIPLLKDRVRA